MKKITLLVMLATALCARAQYQVPVETATLTNVFTVARVDVRQVLYKIQEGAFTATATFDWIGTNGVAVRSGDAVYTQNELVGALGPGALDQCLALASALPGTNVTGIIRMVGGQLIVTSRFTDVDAHGGRTSGNKLLMESNLRGYGVDPDQLKMWMRMLARVAVGQNPPEPQPEPAPEPAPEPEP